VLLPVRNGSGRDHAILTGRGLAVNH
jgi:hypothetical protein